MTNKYWKRVDHKCQFEHMLFMDEMEMANKEKEHDRALKARREARRKKDG